MTKARRYTHLAPLTLLAAGAVSSRPAHAQPHLITQAIVGGREVDDPGASPTAMLSTCSATLLTSRLLLTAAHCLIDQPKDARFGTAGEPVPITSCKAHPRYGSADGYDIAYCLLANAVPHATASVISSCEPVMPGTQVSLAGYGYVDNTQRTDRTQRMVSVHVDEVRSGGRELLVGDGQHGACHGDSGGSAFSTRDHEQLRLLGVISRRGPAADGTFAPDCEGETILTAILPHLAWLESETGAQLGTACSAEDAPPSSTGGCSLGSPVAEPLAWLVVLTALPFCTRRRFFS